MDYNTFELKNVKNDFLPGFQLSCNRKKGSKLKPPYTDNAKLTSQKMAAHALVNGGQAYAIWAELVRCSRDSIGVGGQKWRYRKKSNCVWSCRNVKPEWLTLRSSKL